MLAEVVPPWAGYRVVETGAAEQHWTDSVSASHRYEDIKSRFTPGDQCHPTRAAELQRDLMERSSVPRTDFTNTAATTAAALDRPRADGQQPTIGFIGLTHRTEILAGFVGRDRGGAGSGAAHVLLWYDSARGTHSSPTLVVQLQGLLLQWYAPVIAVLVAIILHKGFRKLCAKPPPAAP
ncbi:hypothetical protein PLESTM_000106100 [Pleodorina starrii]|nr:hypothetical protein PLESTM_000106100 [Pleodorina starrii]